MSRAGALPLHPLIPSRQEEGVRRQEEGEHHTGRGKLAGLQWHGSMQRPHPSQYGGRDLGCASQRNHRKLGERLDNSVPTDRICRLMWQAFLVDHATSRLGFSSPVIAGWMVNTSS